MRVITIMCSYNWCVRKKRCPTGSSRLHMYHSLPPLSMSNPPSSCLLEAITSYIQRTQKAAISYISVRSLLCSLARVLPSHIRIIKPAQPRTVRTRNTNSCCEIGVGEGVATILFYSYSGLMLDQIDSYDLISAKLC